MVIWRRSWFGLEKWRSSVEIAIVIKVMNLPDSAVLLLAADLASIPELASLRALIAEYPQVLHQSAVLEILLKVVPETTSPEDYLSIIYHLYRHEPETGDISRIPASVIESTTRNTKRKLDLYKLGESQDLTKWFFDRARRVEEATGMIDLARRLVLPEGYVDFPPEEVRRWGRGVIQVLETFIFDNDDEDEVQLLLFENLEPDSAIRLLLSRTTPTTVARDVRQLVPFIDYAGRGWETVWEWLIDRGRAGEMEYIANLDLEEDGFIRTCLIACYLCHKSSSSVRADLHRIYDIISRRSQGLPVGQIVLEQTDVLDFRNSSLTTPTRASLSFLQKMIQSADIIASYAPEMALREIVSVCEGSQQTQMDLIRIMLNGTKRNAEQWRKLRQSLRTLHDHGVLGKLADVDRIIFAAMLDATAFGIAREIFVRSHVLPTSVLEETILEVFYRFYDNATSGNRTQGGMKNAFQTLHVLDDPNHGSTAHAIHLVSATHALSHYSLFLTPGVPISPAQIRMNKDPAMLIVKVIDMNPHTYRE